MMSKPVFGQVVIGPPGSGKTTYCAGMSEFLSSLKRKVAVINLDPANENIPYKPDVDISDLITVTDVMDNLDLGPNGALLYCMDYLNKNVDWLMQKLHSLKDRFLIFDFPGQVELYTHHSGVKSLLEVLQKYDYRLVAVYLVDAHYCSDPGKFISVLMTCLTTMINIELPHVNVLSKIDLAEKFGKLHHNLDFYTEVMDLNYLLELLDDDPFTKKYKKLNEALKSLIESYSLVSFLPLNINDQQSLTQVRNHTDKACGYVFNVGEHRGMTSLFSAASGAQLYDTVLETNSEALLDDEMPFSKI